MIDIMGEVQRTLGLPADPRSATGSLHAKMTEMLARLPVEGAFVVQYGTVTIANGSSSNTATITSVDTTKSHLVFLGSSISADPAVQSYEGRVALTNSTTVTASRNGTTNDLIVSFVCVTWSTSVSVQAGTVVFSGTTNTSNTATITSVDTTRSILFWLGLVHQASAVSQGQVRITLTNATTVTGTRGSGGAGSQDTTAGFAIVQF